MALMLLLLTKDQNYDIFPFKSISYENIMSSHSKLKQPVSKDRVARFVQYLSEIFSRIKSTPPSEMLELADKVKEIKIKGVTHHIADPAAFFRMSDALYRNNSLTMGELSQATFVPLATATRIVSFWVDNGLAQRFSDPKDRRIVRVSLTNSGRKIHAVMENFMSHNIQIILGCLTSEEQTTLLTLLERIVTNLKGDVR
jgi:DNA-binding MarR family transcriptional regulator